MDSWRFFSSLHFWCTTDCVYRISPISSSLPPPGGGEVRLVGSIECAGIFFLHRYDPTHHHSPTNFVLLISSLPWLCCCRCVCAANFKWASIIPASSGTVRENSFFSFVSFLGGILCGAPSFKTSIKYFFFFFVFSPDRIVQPRGGE